MTEHDDTPKLTADDVQKLADFDVEAFIAGFKPPRFTAALFREPELAAQIEALDREIDQIEEDKRNKVRRSFAEKGKSHARLIKERNELVERLEAGKVTFEFRPWESLAEAQQAAQDAKDSGYGKDDLLVMARGMASTCVSHPLTFDGWVALSKQVGAPAFLLFGAAWLAGVNGQGPSAPFSPRPLPTRDTTEPAS